MADKPKSRSGDRFDEVRKEGYVARARVRALRRRSKWNLLLIPLALGASLASYVVLLEIVIACRTLVLQQPATLGDIARSRCSGLAPVVLFVGPIFAALPVGMLLANWVAWCLPAARRTFQREAQGAWHASFQDAQRDLLLISRLLVPLGVGVGIVGAVLLRCPA